MKVGNFFRHLGREQIVESSSSQAYLSSITLLEF